VARSTIKGGRVMDDCTKEFVRIFIMITDMEEDAYENFKLSLLDSSLMGTQDEVLVYNYIQALNRKRQE
jgi:hypothetical protein